MHEQEARELTGRRRELLNILPGLRRFALSLTGSTAAADDLLHAAVARVLERGLPADAELLPFCIRVCRQLWQDASAAGELRRTAGSDCAPGATRTIAHTEDRAGIQTALSALSDEQRAVLELVAVEGHSWRAAAALLDIPIGQVMNRLARARGVLIQRCAEGARSPLQSTVHP
jgi:RNA polymerase sigma factor (sigma-70 family)